MKVIYWILMVVPGIAFFMDDYGQYTVPLRVFGVLLILLMIYDIWNKKDISQYVCKVIYFPLFLIVWVMKVKAQIKRNKREQRLKYFRPWYVI